MSTRQVVLCEESLTMEGQRRGNSPGPKLHRRNLCVFVYGSPKTEYAEAFIRERAQTSDYLTVTPNDLSSATQTGRETLDRIGQFESGRADGDAR